MGDISYAFRTLRKSPLSSLTIVLTVALGLGMVTAVFTLLNVFLFRVDAVPNVHEFYGLERRDADGEQVRLTRSMYDAVTRETSIYNGVFAMVSEIDSRVDGQTMSGALVTGNFFEILGVSAAEGRGLTPADDDAGNPVVVLSARARSRHFSGASSVVGRTLNINGIRYDIVGVMPDGFRGLVVSAPDFWAPLSVARQVLKNAAADLDVDIIGRLRPDVTRQVALAQVMAWDARRTEIAVDKRPPPITLRPRQGTIPQPMEAVVIFTPLFVSFGLILLIGCANVASLLLARAVARQKEIGVRLSLGASRAQIVRQLLAESLVLALLAAGLGYVISRIILETTVWAVMTTMPPDIGDVRLLVPDGDWRVAVFLVAGAMVASIMFGLAPAMQATRLELVRTMRGEIVRDARPGRTRNLLIGVQVTASAVLLICSAIFLRSAMAASTIDPGLRTADTLMIPVQNESARQKIVDAVAHDPLVIAMAATFPDPLTGVPMLAESAQAKATAAAKFASSEFFGVFGIEIVHGRGFTAAERHANAAVAIVAESFARQMWPDGNVLGQALRLTTDPAAPPRQDGMAPPTGSFTIIGVAQDVAGFAFIEVKPANVYVPTAATDPGTILAVRAHGDPETARAALLQRLLLIDPNMEQIVTMRTIAGMATYFLQVAFWLTLVLGALALALTVSGLFSVLSYLVEQRRKEIGVRMALGATAADVGRLVMGQTARPVVVGLAIGVGFALALAIALLASPATSFIGALVHVLDPVAYAASLVVIALACVLAALMPTLQAARIEPIQTLRQD